MRQALVILALLVAPASPALGQAQPFDAGKAWLAFNTLVRQNYPYFKRDGVDGDAIMARFAPTAQAAITDDAFITALKPLSRSFADPHFVIGPLKPGDYNILPTASDLDATMEQGRWYVRTVRYGSAAMTAKIETGDEIVSIDGLAPDAAIETVTATPAKDLSTLQRWFAINVALAGKINADRVLVLQRERVERTVTLPSPILHARQIADGPPLTVDWQGQRATIRINNSLGDNALIGAFDKAMADVARAHILTIDLRDTPSGGNTTVARAILGHFTSREQPYQRHVVPYEERVFGVRRSFVEYVAPRGSRFRGGVYAVGGRWTGSMGEGLMIGFDALGMNTVGSGLGDLLGAISNLEIEGSNARIDMPTEALFHVNGTPREDFLPERYLPNSERTEDGDPAEGAISGRPVGRVGSIGRTSRNTEPLLRPLPTSTGGPQIVRGN